MLGEGKALYIPKYLEEMKNQVTADSRNKNTVSLMQVKKTTLPVSQVFFQRLINKGYYLLFSYPSDIPNGIYRFKANL